MRTHIYTSVDVDHTVPCDVHTTAHLVRLVYSTHICPTSHRHQPSSVSKTAQRAVAIANRLAKGDDGRANISTLANLVRRIHLAHSQLQFVTAAVPICYTAISIGYEYAIPHVKKTRSKTKHPGAILMPPHTKSTRTNTGAPYEYKRLAAWRRVAE